MATGSNFSSFAMLRCTSPPVILSAKGEKTLLPRTCVVEGEACLCVRSSARLGGYRQIKPATVRADDDEWSSLDEIAKVDKGHPSRLRRTTAE